MRALVVSPEAERDLDDLLAFTEERFGARTAERHRRLVDAAPLDLRLDPRRPGMREDSDLPPGLRLYHLRFSRSRPPAAERILRPRHLIAFRADRRQVEVLRVLQDAMDIPRHLRGSEAED